MVHHSAFVSRVFVGMRLYACYCQKRNRNSKSVDICASRYPAAVCQPDSWIRERMGPKTAKVASRPRPSGSESTTRPEIAKENMGCVCERARKRVGTRWPRSKYPCSASSHRHSQTWIRATAYKPICKPEKEKLISPFILWLEASCASKT